MFGWQARPCTNLHGMYRWFGVVIQGGFLVLLCVHFRSSLLAVFWEWFLGVFGGCHVWGSCASLAGDFALKSFLNRTRFGGFSSWASSWPREAIFFDSSWLWAIQVDSFEVEVAQEVTQLFLKFRCNPWSDSGDQARRSWGLTCGFVFWERQSNRLEGAV
jgi:hypothetical protein